MQTSGRSLHAQEMAFNDIRTTLQALTALQDHCNSLHTNAYDEAVTTPTEESVRRALAIQLIINRELGLAKNENPLQGAYVIEELTDRVEAAVLRGVRAALGARRRAGRDGDALPAQPHPGREPLLRDAEALGRAADRRRQHLRESASRGERGARASWRARARTRSARSSTNLRAFHARHAGASEARAAPPAATRRAAAATCSPS